MKKILAPIAILALGIALMVSGCKKDPLKANEKNTTLSINDIRLYNLTTATSIKGKFTYIVTIPIAGSTRDTSETFFSEFNIINALNQSQTIQFNLPENVKSVKASCSITIEGGSPEKLIVSSFKLVTKGVEKINVNNLEANFSSDFYLVGPYEATY